MTLALEARAKAGDIIIGDTPKAKQRRKRLVDLSPAGCLWKHSTLRDIDGIVDASAMQGYFVLTIVRYLWDRIVSYYHWAREQSFDHPVLRATRDQDYRRYYTNELRGYVQMISRDLSMPFKGFYIPRKPEHHVPPGGTAGQRLPAPLAGAFTLSTF